MIDVHYHSVMAQVPLLPHRSCGRFSMPIREASFRGKITTLLPAFNARSISWRVNHWIRTRRFTGFSEDSAGKDCDDEEIDTDHFFLFCLHSATTAALRPSITAVKKLMTT